MSRRVYITDTTLRDGEQSPDLAYMPLEKLTLAQCLLTEVGVDRIEVASAGASPGEAEAVRCIAHLEALGIALSPARSAQLLTRIVALADRKLTVHSADLLRLIDELD